MHPCDRGDRSRRRLLTAGCKQKTDSNEQNSAPPATACGTGVVTSHGQSRSGNAADAVGSAGRYRDKALSDLRSDRDGPTYEHRGRRAAMAHARSSKTYMPTWRGPIADLCQGLANDKCKIVSGRQRRRRSKTNPTTVRGLYSAACRPSGGLVLHAPTATVAKNDVPPTTSTTATQGRAVTRIGERPAWPSSTSTTSRSTSATRS